MIEYGVVVAIGLFLAAEILLSIRSNARISAAQEALTRTVVAFTTDTQRRFDSQDGIILGHTENIREHSAKIGVLEGKVLRG